MFLIAHRGNTVGPLPEFENSIEYIEHAINENYYAEIDLHVIDNILYLGHDEPQYVVTGEWLFNNLSSLWVHCKNLQALEYCLDSPLNYFWHNTDDYTLTSLGFVWAYPGKQPSKHSCIMVMPEQFFSIDSIKELKHAGVLGVCSDYVEKINK